MLEWLFQPPTPHPLLITMLGRMTCPAQSENFIMRMLCTWRCIVAIGSSESRDICIHPQHMNMSKLAAKPTLQNAKMVQKKKEKKDWSLTPVSHQLLGTDRSSLHCQVFVSFVVSQFGFWILGPVFRFHSSPLFVVRPPACMAAFGSCFCTPDACICILYLVVLVEICQSGPTDHRTILLERQKKSYGMLWPALTDQFGGSGCADLLEPGSNSVKAAGSILCDKGG